MGRDKEQHQPQWTYRDDVLLYTCHLVAKLNTGADLSEVPEVLAPFPPRVSGEWFWAAGPFTLSDWRALGDGSWSVSTPFVFGTGAVGAGLAVGSMIGGAAAKRRARQEALAAATPRWVPIEQGTLFMSRYGFYMHTPRVLGWQWQAITGANLVGPGALHLSGDSADGPVSWLLHSDWAELVFVTWALDQHSRHPQLLTGWLPPGWVEHAYAWQQSIPPAALSPPTAGPDAPA